jgi:hypothetical protein
MSKWHAFAMGFAAVFVGAAVKSALKNYLNFSL